MVQKNSLKKIIVIVGPTGVGKTKLSIEIAKKYHGEIINADQSQMHKLLNIGTAKITPTEMQGVKHYFIDTIDAIDNYSIGDYQKEARQIIDNLDSLPIIVGGSGLYVDALITDYDLNVNKRDSSFEDKYKDYTNDELYKLLEKLNMDAANKTHPNNRKRVLRYLELVMENGTIEKKENVPYYDALIFFINQNREVLYNNINKRCEKMFLEGWIEEVKSLIKMGIDISLIKEIGYLDIYRYINNEITLEETKEKIKKETRHYAKRQITWFKNKMNCIELINDESINDKVYEYINNFIKGDKNESF
mgnify:FL=1